MIFKILESSGAYDYWDTNNHMHLFVIWSNYHKAENVFNTIKG